MGKDAIPQIKDIKKQQTKKTGLYISYNKKIMQRRIYCHILQQHFIIGLKIFVSDSIMHKLYSKRATLTTRRY